MRSLDADRARGGIQPPGREFSGRYNMTPHPATAACLVKSLGYIGLRSPGLDDWPHFAGGVLGMQVLRDDADTLRLRMDEMVHRYIIRRAEQASLDYIGFDVGSMEDLAALRDHLKRGGFAVTDADAEDLRDRRVAAMC